MVSIRNVGFIAMNIQQNNVTFQGRKPKRKPLEIMPTIYEDEEIAKAAKISAKEQLQKVVERVQKMPSEVFNALVGYSGPKTDADLLTVKKNWEEIIKGKLRIPLEDDKQTSTLVKEAALKKDKEPKATNSFEKEYWDSLIDEELDLDAEFENSEITNTPSEAKPKGFGCLTKR